MRNNTRIEKMNAAGIDTNKFFDVNIQRIPVGSNVQILVDGKPYDINGNTTNIVNDDVVKNIQEKSWISNARLFRRWIMAQTLRMMYEPFYNYRSKKMEVGWNEYFNAHYDYNYQFSMLEKELKTLSIIENKDREAFEERINFFNKDVVVDTCRHYMRKLRQFINQQPKKKWHGNYYYVVKKPYNVYVPERDVDIVLYNPLELIIFSMETAMNYTELYNYFFKFCCEMVRLDGDTTKCPAWKDAFKGAGAYYTLKNGVMFHNMKIVGDSDVATNLNYLSALLNMWGGSKHETWRFHKILKDYCDKNNFYYYWKERISK